MKRLLFALSLLVAAATVRAAEIPATPVMTLYRFNGALDIPYYDIASFGPSSPSAPAGTLAQGTSVVPCLPIRNGQPLTDDQGIPYVGFKVIVDARTATPTAVARYTQVARERQALRVDNHHCEAGVRYVLDVRNLYAMDKPPVFEPPRPSPVPASTAAQPQGELDRIIRAFHNSSACATVNQGLVGRPAALRNAWNAFIAASRQQWPEESLQRARHLDYTMRTALFEAHLDRGCSAYGACERNIIALSIRNRGLESCVRGQGCSAPGDFQGVATKVSQYNIWDEYLAQVSGLTACYLRNDLAAGGGTQYFKKLQSMYSQNLAEVQRILYGTDQDLAAIFPGNSLADLKGLKHYYHAPAMGKCFPQYDRVEYISGAVARKGNDFALIANTRIQVGQQTTGGYFFRRFAVREEAARDVATITDSYPGFVIDGKRVSLKDAPSRCVPYGIPDGCAFKEIGRYRRTPSWVNAGKPLAVICRTADRGEQCQAGGQAQTVKVGGTCDTEMRPFTGIK
ncbi:hypothetical protein [Desulfobulbus sp.]|uniref:hypothetical protein n=1 Tax=Desulfobulbus sp. TaxID=895 RepID=UPI00286F3DF3|nr:hypothetical protein [Desulfobulbus sp.]